MKNKTKKLSKFDWDRQNTCENAIVINFNLISYEHRQNAYNNVDWDSQSWLISNRNWRTRFSNTDKIFYWFFILQDKMRGEQRIKKKNQWKSVNYASISIIIISSSLPFLLTSHNSFFELLASYMHLGSLQNIYRDGINWSIIFITRHDTLCQIAKQTHFVLICSFISITKQKKNAVSIISTHTEHNTRLSRPRTKYIFPHRRSVESCK